MDNIWLLCVCHSVKLYPIVKFLTHMSSLGQRKKINSKNQNRILANISGRGILTTPANSTYLHTHIKETHASNYMSHMEIFLKIMVSAINYRGKSCKWLIETNFSSGVLQWIYRISKSFIIFKWRYLRQAFAPFI